MTTGQTIEAKITVDAKQATAEVDKFSGKLSTVEEKAKASSVSLSGLQEQAKGLQAKLGPAAAAISGIAGALGETNGEAGKALAAIGQVTAAGLIGEVGDFTKFGTISEVMKLAGLDPYEVSSGKHRGTLRISKRGRPLMRKLLYLAALSAVTGPLPLRGICSY